MEELTAESVQEIGLLHSAWIDCELRGKHDQQLEFCADDIELWPPDAAPVRGKSTVRQYLNASEELVNVEISDRQIHGSCSLAYLTASFRTTFFTADYAGPKHTIGNHLWILRRSAQGWRIILVSWSVTG